MAFLNQFKVIRSLAVVMDALDLPHGPTGRCSGFGGGRVNVSSTAGVEGNGESGPYGACVEKHPLP